MRTSVTKSDAQDDRPSTGPIVLRRDRFGRVFTAFAVFSETGQYLGSLDVIRIPLGEGRAAVRATLGDTVGERITA